jgi:hypothetical protein
MQARYWAAKADKPSCRRFEAKRKAIRNPVSWRVGNRTRAVVDPLHASKIIGQEQGYPRVPPAATALGGAWKRPMVATLRCTSVPTNLRAIEGFLMEVIRAWRFALKRRGQLHRLPWTCMTVLINRWISRACIRHLWPWTRFHANTQGRS